MLKFAERFCHGLFGIAPDPYTLGKQFEDVRFKTSLGEVRFDDRRGVWYLQASFAVNMGLQSSSVLSIAQLWSDVSILLERLNAYMRDMNGAYRTNQRQSVRKIADYRQYYNRNNPPRCPDCRERLHYEWTRHDCAEWVCLNHPEIIGFRVYEDGVYRMYDEEPFKEKLSLRDTD